MVNGVVGEHSATRCSPETVTVVFKSKRRHLCLTGKGKRRRSCDEEEEGEPKAKKQKQDGESSEVRQQCHPRLCGAVNRRQLPLGPDAAGASVPGLPRAELLPPPPLSSRDPASSQTRSPGETKRAVSCLVFWFLSRSLVAPLPQFGGSSLSLFPHSLHPTMAFTGKSTSTGSTSIFETRGSSVPWPTAWIRFVEALRTLSPSLSASGQELDGRGGEVSVPAAARAQDRGSPTLTAVSFPGQTRPAAK